MPQGVKIVSQSEEQGLASLGKQGAARCAAGQFALGHGEDGFNQGAAAILLARKVGAHLGSDAMNPPVLFSTFGGDDAEGMKLLADEVWLRSLSNSASANTQPTGVSAWASATSAGRLAQSFHGGLTCRLRRDELSLQVDDGQPLQPMPPRQRLLGVVIHATYEEGAHRAFGKSGCLYSYVGAASRTGQCHAMNHFVQGVGDCRLVQSAQEAQARRFCDSLVIGSGLLR